MIQLTSGSLVCEIEPHLGGCIAGLWLGGIPVLRSTPAGALVSVRQSACYPMVPFSNRIAQSTLQWQGTLYPLVRNDGVEPHAVHGVGWQRPWGVLESAADFALISYEHRADSAWPFAFDCSQVIRLRGNALELTLSLTNQAREAAPAGLGWHPYFPKRAGAHLAFHAQGRWEPGEDRLPTRRVASQGVDADCASLVLDHCFDGWDGAALFSDGQVCVRITSGLSRLVVHTDAERDTIAIEPVSHVTNAVALAAAGGDREQLGLVTLQPGESMSAMMTMEVERAAC